MRTDYVLPQFDVLRDMDRCTECGICVNECANGVHFFRKNKENQNKITSNETKCVDCLRCVIHCPV